METTGGLPAGSPGAYMQSAEAEYGKRLVLSTDALAGAAAPANSLLPPDSVLRTGGDFKVGVSARRLHQALKRTLKLEKMGRRVNTRRSRPRLNILRLLAGSMGGVLRAPEPVAPCFVRLTERRLTVFCCPVGNR
jgi:hypothetical protein